MSDGPIDVQGSNILKVLIVDDDERILDFLTVELLDQGYDVVTTHSPLEALDLIQKDEYAVIVSDHHMEEMLGTELLEKVKEVCSDTIRIMLTGKVDKRAMMEAINKGSVYRFMEKPWDDDELRVVIHEAVERYNLVVGNRSLFQQTEDQLNELKELNDQLQSVNKELKDLNDNLESIVAERTKQLALFTQRFRESFMGTVRVLSRVMELIEVRKWGRQDQCQRMVTLSRAVAKRMGMAELNRLHLSVATRLHDVGKIVLPNHLLDRPEHLLSPDERKVFRDPDIRLDGFG